jgi:hypothetical protein
MTLEGSRRASGQFCNAPAWVVPRSSGGGMARKDRHSLFEGRMDAGSLLWGMGLARAPAPQRRVRNRSDCVKRTATSFFSSTLWDEDRQPDGTNRFGEEYRRGTDSFVKGLILAQNERWRRGLGMQVERAW